MSISAEIWPDYPQTSATSDQSDESDFDGPRALPFQEIEHQVAEHQQLVRTLAATVLAAAGSAIGLWTTRSNRAPANSTKLRI